MYKRILVPLDGSELAEKALPYAEKLAAALDSEVILVNVSMPSEDPANPRHRTYISKMAGVTEQNIKKLASLKPGEKVKVSSAIIGSQGVLLHAGEHIVNYAEKENISLIVIATHGMTGIRRWILGSTANKVAQAAKCPVLLVRAAADVPRVVSLQKLLVPLDGSQESEAILGHVEFLAGKLNASVNLVNVVEPMFHIYVSPEAAGYYVGSGIIRIPYTKEEMEPAMSTAEGYIKRVNEKLNSEGVKSSYELKMEAAWEGIIEAEGDTGADMVVMSTFVHSGFGRFDHGSVTDKVIHAGNTPLLLIRPK